MIAPTHDDTQSINQAQTFDELWTVADQMIQRQRQDLGFCPVLDSNPQLHEVCGPMTTGGFGNLEQNMAAYSKAVNIMFNQGLPVFSPVAFQGAMERIHQQHCQHQGYCWGILDKFYRPLFESGHIKCVWFIPGWETSTGSQWERRTAHQLGIEIRDIPHQWEHDTGWATGY